LCLVGKGVTFDSGGLSAKNAAGLIGMQLDMAAVASIAYAMALLPTVAPSLNVRAYCPLVENMPGPYSTRPGDIVTARNGLTIEILDTDFEGRVILADGLAFAAEQHPRHLIDMATLTYGAPNSVGPRMSALFGNGDVMGLVEQAAAASGEPVWRLPMLEYLMPTIRSRAADVKNFPYEQRARASTAAMFLREFVPTGTSWAHLDMGGPAWADDPYEVNPVGATGYGVRMLLEIFGLLR
jgi:leucyl aminopeptidase